MESNREQPQTGADFSLSLKDILVLVRFVPHAVARHRWLAIACFLGTLALSVGALKLMSKSYMVTTRIMTQSAVIIPTLTIPGGTSPLGSPSAVTGVSEIMKSRANLTGIIEDTNLIERWRMTRSPVGRASDAVTRLLFGEPSPDDFFESILTVLDQKLWVDIEGSVVVIRFTWHDADTAYEVVEAASRRFMAERRQWELGELQETVRILEGKHSAAMEQLQLIAKQGEAAARRLSVEEGQSATARRAEVRRPAPSADLAELEQALASVRGEIERLEATHKQRRDQAQAQLAQLESTYGPQHPEIVKTTRYLELLKAQSPVPDALVAKAAQLKEAIARLQSAALESSAESARARSPQTTVRQEVRRDFAVEQVVSLEQQAAEVAVNTNGELLGNARMLLEAAEAALEYRYKVTHPAVFPRRPIKPKPAQIVGGALLLGLLLGVLFSVLADVRSGVILESWQIPLGLEVPLLGELKEK